MPRPLLVAVLLLLLQQSGCVAARYGDGSEPSGASRSTTAKQSLLAGFQLFNGALERAPTQVLGDLDEARGGASGEELKAIDTLKPLLEDQLSHQPISPASERLLGRLLQQFGKEHSDDFEVQLTVAIGLDRIDKDLQATTGHEAVGDSDSITSTSSVVRALTLVGAFPNQSRAHAYLAKMQASAGGDQISGMRSYVRCLQLDPNSVPCRTGFKLMAAEFTKATCTAYSPAKFSIQRAYSQTKRGSKSTSLVTLNDRRFYVDQRIALNGNDLQDISPAAASADDTWLVTLTPEGAQRYAALTSELAAKQDFVLIRIDGKAVSAARVFSTVDSGQLSIPRSGVDPAKLCQKSQRRSLPPDLVDLVR